MDEKRERKEKDTCVICGKETPFTKNSPVDMRRNYIEGVDQIGQICDSCAENLRKEGIVV